MSLDEIGELEAIDGFVGAFEPCEELVVGPGEDDCAVLDLGDRYLVQSSDVFIDGTHFPEEASPWQVGWHSAAATLADVASMGADALGLTLSTTAPGDSEESLLLGMAEGADAAAREAGGCVVGGDLNEDRLSVDVGATGLTEGDPLLRSGAGEGDAVCVTGPLGGAAAAVMEIEGEIELPGNGAMERLLEPPVVAGKGRRLSGEASACLDLSDGLYRGMEAVSRESGVGLQVDLQEVPLHAEAEAAIERGADAAELVNGGGDYELLFTAPPEAADSLGFPVIGEVGGREPELIGGDTEGYDAFS